MVCERVWRERSLNLTLTVTVRAALEEPRSMVATDSAMRSTWRSSSPGSTRSWLKVSSCPMDLAGRSGVTGLGSSPRASADRCWPLALPTRRSRARPGWRPGHPRCARRARAAASRWPAQLPTAPPPDGAWRNANSSAGSMRTTPGPGSSPERSNLGFAAREASLAIILERPIPTAQPKDRSARTRSRRRCAITSGGPSRRIAAGDVEKRLVQPDRLHHRGDVGQDPMQLPADLGVATVSPGQEDGLRAQLAGPHRGHGRSDTEDTGLVGARRHDAPGTGPADYDRQPRQRGVIEHLDRREEGVHVDMQDGGDLGGDHPRSVSRRKPSANCTPARRPSSSARRRTASPAHPPGSANCVRWHSTAAALHSMVSDTSTHSSGFERARQQDRGHLVRRSRFGKVQRQGGGRRHGVEQGGTGDAMVAVVEVLLAEEHRRGVMATHHVGSQPAYPFDQAHAGTHPSRRVRRRDSRGWSHSPARSRADDSSSSAARMATRLLGFDGGIEGPLAAVGADHEVDGRSRLGPAGQRSPACDIGVIRMGIHGQRHPGYVVHHRRLGSVVLVRRPTSRWKSPASSKPL